MNTQISNYVDVMQNAVLYDLVTTDASDLYEIATQLIAQNEEDLSTICQAYEVVKHALLGTVIIN
ncbi:MAG: hypothetical protein ABS948_03825 [Solibacillus sp.]